MCSSPAQVVYRGPQTNGKEKIENSMLPCVKIRCCQIPSHGIQQMRTPTSERQKRGSATVPNSSDAVLLQLFRIDVRLQVEEQCREGILRRSNQYRFQERSAVQSRAI